MGKRDSKGTPVLAEGQGEPIVTKVGSWPRINSEGGIQMETKIIVKM